MQKQQLASGRCQYRSRLLQWYAGVGIALLAPFLLSWMGLITRMDTQFALLGLDGERASLLTSLLLAFLSSLCAAFCLQHCGPPWLAGLILFVLRCLFPFVQLALHPDLSPAGQAQVLIPAACMSVTLPLLALGIVSTGAGAVIGKACGAILLVPLVTLSWHVLARRTRSSFPLIPPSVRVSLLKLTTGGLVVGSFILAASGTLSLLTYGPTTNLYHPVSVLNKRTPNRGGAALTTGTVQSASFNSSALGGIKRALEIYLPPSYFVAPRRHYPTLYLLHGSPGGPDDWFRAAHAATTADALIAAGKMRETILIGVDGNGPLYRFSEWAHSFDGRQRMEDALPQDLLPFIDTPYRTLAGAANRAIGGLSMGGYGAVNIALHHPEMFRAVMSLGGYFQAAGPGVGFGAVPAAYRQFNSPSRRLQPALGKKSASRITFVIGVGTKDGRYYREGMAFYHQLLTTGVPAHLLINTGGHAWSLWANQLAEALPFLEPAPSESAGVMAPVGETPFLYRRNTGHRGIPLANHSW